MEPVSAVVFALIASWAIVNAAWDAGVDQAKAEARHTADAIRKDLRERREAWAEQLVNRLEKGRTASPATAAWWGWAATRTAKAVRRGLKRQPRVEEKAIGGPTGPFRRIFGAAWRGAKFARDEARRNRDAREKVRSNPVGVCGRCGVVAAKDALVFALTRFGRQERMCRKCQADVAAERAADERAAQTAADEPGSEPVDADITTPTGRRPRELDEGKPGRGNTPDAPPAPDPTDQRKPMTVGEIGTRTPVASTETATPAAVEAASAGDASNDREGETMARGSLIPYRASSPATRSTALTRRGGGDSYTHGAWNHAVKDIERRLEMLPALLEQMLQSLNHADAGRSQVTGVVAFYHGAVQYIGQLQDMLREVNRREMPVVHAVTDAGGPDEVPGIPYLRDI